MKKAIIGITSEALNIGKEFRASYKVNLLNVDYKNLVENRGAVPIIIPITSDLELAKKYVQICDGFVFSGGADINPITYDEKPHIALGPGDLERDEFEIRLMKEAIDAKKPILGICRGMQILNITQGGTLIQHIPDVEGSFNHLMSGNKYDVAHKVRLKKDNILHNVFGDEVYVNSSHHQGINKLGTNLEVIGRAGDGIIEAIKLEEHDFVYGVQWHPEELVYKQDEINKLIDKFLRFAK